LQAALVAVLLGTAWGCGADGATGGDALADAQETTEAVPAVLADQVVEAPGAGEGPFGDPQKAVNGVRGGGDAAGSTDVFTLGFAAGEDDLLVLGWSGRVAGNGPGTDLVVFENAFRIGDGAATFIEPAVVSVSRDGVAFVDFPHRYDGTAGEASLSDPAAWEGFAGLTPVRWNVDSREADPFDREAAGGDAFDLDDLPADGGEGDAMRAGGFRFVRIRSAATQVDPATGLPFPRSAVSNGPDIDGVAARYLVPEA